MQLTTLQVVLLSAGLLIAGAYIVWKHRGGNKTHITEPQQATHRAFQQLIDHLPFMVCAFDSTGRPTTWNRECARVTGYPAEEMLHNPQALERLLPDAEYRRRILGERRKRGGYRNWEWTITTREGARKVISWYSAPFFRLPNNQTSWWQIGVDMSAITHAQHTLRQQYSVLQTQNEILRALLDSITAPHTEPDEQQLLAALGDTLHRLIPFDAMLVLSVQDARLRLAHARGYRPSLLEQVAACDFRLSRFPVLQALVQEKAPILLPDVRESPLWQVPPAFAHVRSWMGAPLHTSEALLGILWLEGAHAGVFEERHLSTLTLFSRYAAQALHNIHLQQEMRAALQREQMLNQAMRRISSALDRPLILQTGAHLACELFQAEAACFVLRAPSGDLYIAYQRNMPADIPLDTPLPPDELLCNPINTNTSLLLHNYAEYPKARPEWVQAGLSACLGTPLPGDKGPQGALYLFRKRGAPPFSLQDLNGLETIAWQIGTALQNAALFADERQRADELGALRDTLADLSAQLAMPDLMQAILQRAVALLLAHGGELGLYDAERGGLRVVASYNMGEIYTGNFIPVGRGIMGTVVQTGELLTIPDYRQWENHLPGYRSSICRSVIAAPLRARGRLLGVISIVDSRPNRQFAPNEIRMLKTFAQQAAVAVDNVQLFESAYHRAEEAETLREVSLIVAGLLDEEDAISRILELVGRVITCDSAVVALREGEDLRVVGERHWKQAPSLQGAVFSAHSLTPYAQVARRCRPLLIADTAVHYPQWAREKGAAHIRSWLGVPLGTQEHSLGVLAVHSALPGYFTTTHQRLLSAFASHVTVAITNARLYQEAQYLAVTDPLTTLYNRRYFFQIAAREFERAVRHGYNISILMVDIDRFKSVNDTYGHQIGDDVLRKVALACRESVREIDILARYGGEEFIVMLPDTGLEGALHVAQRLHQRVCNMPVRANGYEIRITVSVGAASLNKGADSLDALIGQADKALYHAKQNGRNQVACWDNIPAG